MTDRELIQMALDALEYPGPSWPDARQKAAEALRATLAQPEQKPHGYLWFTRHMEQRFTHRHPKEDERIGDVKSVYTAPPQREWQGLTQKEVMYIVKVNTDPWCDTPETDGYGVAEMVEAKLKEKNSTTEKNIQTSDKND